MINESSLIRIRIDYLENKNELHPEEYKTVILKLILEVERLKAEKTIDRMKRSNYCNHD